MVIKAVGDQPRQNVAHGIDGASVARMLDVKDRCEQVVDRLDQPPLAQVELVSQRHQGVLHAAPNLGDDVKPLLVELGEQLSQIAAIPKALSFQPVEQFGQQPCVVIRDVTRRDDEVDQLSVLVDDQMGLQAVKPAHRGLATGGHPGEDLVRADAVVVADGQRLAVGDVEARTLALSAEPFEQHEQPRQQSGHAGHEALVGQQTGEVARQVHLHAVAVVILEAFVAREVIENDQRQHFAVAHLALARGGQTALLGLPVGQGVAKIVAHDEYLNQF